MSRRSRSSMADLWFGAAVTAIVMLALASGPVASLLLGRSAGGLAVLAAAAGAVALLVRARTRRAREQSPVTSRMRRRAMPRAHPPPARDLPVTGLTRRVPAGGGHG